MGLPQQTAIIYFTDKEKAELRSEALRAPGDQEVLARATWTLVSTGTETICYGRRFDPGTHWDQWVKYPFSTGYSMAGVVEAVGPGVTRFKPGDRVASTHSHRQFCVGPESGFHPVPEGVHDRDAAWFTLSYIVQNGVRRVAHELGEDVVVVGLGPLGQLAVQFVNLLGPRALIAVDPVALRLELAARHGATHTLSVGVEEALERVREITGGRLADSVYDMTGHHQVFAGAQQLLRRLGTLSLIGDTGSPAHQHLTSAVIRNSLKIVASHATNTPPHDTEWSHWTRANMIQLFFQYLRSGRMRMADLNTHAFAPSDCQSAYQKLLHDRSSTMGCHFDWSKL